MSETQPSTDRPNVVSIPKIASRPVELSQRPEAMSSEYEPICATASTSSCRRSADSVEPFRGLTGLDPGGNSRRLLPRMSVGLLLARGIAVFGCGLLGPGRACDRNGAPLHRTDHRFAEGPPQQDDWVAAAANGPGTLIAARSRIDKSRGSPHPYMVHSGSSRCRLSGEAWIPTL